MKVTHYTDVEGGGWKPWCGGELIQWRRVKRGEVAILGEKTELPYLIHSLRFEDGNEWDAVNGARSTIRTYAGN